MRIDISNLEFNAIVGILDFERVTPQRVIVDLDLDYIYSSNNFIDYASIVTLVIEDMVSREYELLEDAIISIRDKILSHSPNIQRLKLKISKPDILDNCIVSLSQEYTFEPTPTLSESTTN